MNGKKGPANIRSHPDGNGEHKARPQNPSLRPCRFGAPAAVRGPFFFARSFFFEKRMLRTERKIITRLYKNVDTSPLIVF